VKKVLPPTYFLGALAVAAALHFFVPIRQIVVFPWRLLGLLPLVAGAALNVVADRAFARNGTTVKPFERSTTLVTTGVYRLSRNPMYLGMVLVVLGEAALFGSVTPFVVVPALVVLLDRVFIAPEESKLEDAFGEGFSRYRRIVRRWI
jgi:protein-S-isoprenylcysteine O-methyltransferase Ste14